MGAAHSSVDRAPHWSTDAPADAHSDHRDAHCTHAAAVAGADGPPNNGGADDGEAHRPANGPANVCTDDRAAYRGAYHWKADDERTHTCAHDVQANRAADADANRSQCCAHRGAHGALVSADV